MATARHLSLRTARAYAWRLAFDEFFGQTADTAEDYLEHWYRGAIRSRLDSIIAFAQTIRTNWDGVLRWHQTKDLQRRARGHQLARASSEATGSRIPH